MLNNKKTDFIFLETNKPFYNRQSTHLFVKGFPENKPDGFANTLGNKDSKYILSESFKNTHIRYRRLYLIL